MASKIDTHLDGDTSFLRNVNEPVRVDTVLLWKGNTARGWQLNEEGQAVPTFIEWPIEDQFSVICQHKMKTRHGRMPVVKSLWEWKGYVEAEAADELKREDGTYECPKHILSFLIERGINELRETMKHEKAPYSEIQKAVADFKATVEKANKASLEAADPEPEKPAKRARAQKEA